MVLSCTVVKEAGELDKIGSPVAVDGVADTSSNNAPQPQAQTTNPYNQQQYKQPAPAQQRSSQYDTSFHD
jgi:hypothetical protein